MSAQAAADPRSLFYPKPGWTELAGSGFRIVYSHDETRILNYQVYAHNARLSPTAYADYVERQLNRVRL